MGFSVKDLGARARAAAAAANDWAASEQGQAAISKAKEFGDKVADKAKTKAAETVGQASTGLGSVAGRIADSVKSQDKAAAEIAQAERNTDGPFTQD